MVACQPSQNNVGENWADSGQHDAPTESGTPAGGGTGGDDAPPDPTADVDATTLGAGPNPCREPVLGRVYSVIDGDTIKVETGRGMERVRLIGIDAPEVDHSGPDDECYGEEATEFLEERINEKLVWLTFDSECDDHYDRTLAYVHTHEAFIQRSLLESGMVSAYRVSPNTSFSTAFQADEDTARAMDVGMWGACP